MVRVSFDVRSLWTSPQPSGRAVQAGPNRRRARAAALADAAMIASVGASARSVRRCAIVVTAALAALDDDEALSAADSLDATQVILSRCQACGACGA